MKKLVLLLLFLSSAISANCKVTSAISPRSQSRNKLREIVGTVNHTFLQPEDIDVWYGMVSFMPIYTQTFRGKDLAECLFGASLLEHCDCPTIEIAGSQVANRNPKAWLADYFYLPVDFQSSFVIKPRIQNFLIDIDVYVGMDEYLKDSYFRAYGPITFARWDLNFCECDPIATGTQAHPAGYFAPSEIARDQLLPNFTSYISGCGAPNSVDNVVFQPLVFNRFSHESLEKTGFADLRMELGWNFHKVGMISRFGINIQAAAPTGNKKDACHLFSPIIGNGKHWELGVGITAHHVFYRNCDETHHIRMIFDANLTHMFAAREGRTFDLCGKPMSRYMLAARTCAPVVDGLTGRGNTPSAQFKDEFTPVANLTTIDAKISIPIQADIVVGANFTICNWSVDVGYNLWARSCEKISCPNACADINCFPSLYNPNQQKQWVLKGDARVYGFTSTSSSFLPANSPIGLSASESQATICSGTNFVGAQPQTSFNTNANIDNPAQAITESGGAITFEPGLTPIVGQTTIQTSLDPEFLSSDDIWLVPNRGISNKFYVHVSYNCWEHEKWIPYFGMGGSVELGKTNHACITSNKAKCDPITKLPCSSNSCLPCDGCTAPTDPCFSSCVDCALTQWALWIKGGTSF